MNQLKLLRGLGVAGLMALAAGYANVAAADETPAAPAATTTEQPATPPANTAQTPPAPGSPEEVVCKKDEAATGTRLGSKKICMTRREWAEIQKDSQEAVGDMQDKALRTPGTKPGN